ncbi:hypothetical protein D3C84_742600 [compost metagenome]
MFSQLAFVRHVQIEKLAAGVGHAANFGDAFLETGFVASEIVAYQLAVPLPKEVARMLACTAGTEVINHSLERRKRRSAEGPNVSAVSFLLAWREHLNRGLIGVDHALSQHLFTQRIDQRLELHAGLSDPLRQCRASNRQPGPTKNFLLPVQR